MGIFGKSGKNKPSRKERRELERYNGMAIKYAVEQINGREKVLGENGGIIILDDVIVVMCEAHEVFRCRIKGASVGELMSGNGVSITGIDDNTGERRSVTAHYSYYRKA